MGWRNSEVTDKRKEVVFIAIPIGDTFCSFDFVVEVFELIGTDSEDGVSGKSDFDCLIVQWTYIILVYFKSLTLESDFYIF